MVLRPPGILVSLGGLVLLISSPGRLVRRPRGVLVPRPRGLISRPGGEALPGGPGPGAPRPGGTLPDPKPCPDGYPWPAENLSSAWASWLGEKLRGRESLAARVPLVRRARLAAVSLVRRAALPAVIPLVRRAHLARVRRGPLAACVPLVRRGLPVGHVTPVRRIPLAGRGAPGPAGGALVGRRPRSTGYCRVAWESW